MIDLVFPQQTLEANEEAFITVAEKLEHSGLLFLYEKVDKQVVERIKKLQQKTQLKLFIGLKKTSANLDHRIENLPIFPDLNLIVAEGPDHARHCIEKLDVQLVYNLETSLRGDAPKQPQSGFNHILATIAHEKNKIWGLSFSLLLASRGMKRTQLLGRIKQNIKLCRKYKVQMCFASFATHPYQMRAWRDLVSVGQILGMTPGEAKKAVLGAATFLPANP